MRLSVGAFQVSRIPSVDLLLGADTAQVLSWVFTVQPTATKEARQPMSPNGDISHKDNSETRIDKESSLSSTSHIIIYKWN